VTFFFILSGFVLAWSARPAEGARRFWQRRLARIYPNHAVTLICAVFLAVASGTAITAAVVIPNVLLVQAWSTNPDVYFGLNTVSWSLSCEALFYALFPLLYRGLMALPRRHLWTAAVVAMCLVWTVPLIVRLVHGGPSYWAVWLFPVARTPEFLAGMVLARIVREGLWPGRVIGVWPAALLAVGFYLQSWWTPEPVKHVAVPAIPFALLIAAVGAADATGPGTVFRARWLVLLGEVSFAFYMVHQLVLRVVSFATGVHRPIGVELGIVGVTFGLAVLASWLLHRMVELPAMRALGPRRTVARTAA
jgi:peptidoglycan/LPS O-acetylase OafA/YrhL